MTDPQPWPPRLDPANPVTRADDGRTIERFLHGPRPGWGYPADPGPGWGEPPARESAAAQQNRRSFYLVAPRTPRPGAPLFVVLHSANRTAYDFLGFACLDRKIDAGDDPATAMTNPPADAYALFLNSTNDEWWGMREAHPDAPPPAERRVLDCVAWVAERCAVDRARIYLSGVSMGGCGALGIGLAHGDVFAALQVTVPAGTGYAAIRRGFGAMPAWDATATERAAWALRVAGPGLPDPPVAVDFSSWLDGWATTQPALVHAAQAGRLPLVLGWGPFGHPAFRSLIDRYPPCAAALAFPWQEIRRDAAYPVFTRASCDQRSPWLDTPYEFDDPGQSNAYFRWRNREDAPEAIALELWIAHPPLANPPPMPEAATADVTLRRMQCFAVEPGRDYAWSLTREGVRLAGGRIRPDAANLLTIPALPLTTAAAELRVVPG